MPISSCSRLASCLALLLNDKLKGAGWLRKAVFTPFVTSTVAAGVVFIWMLDAERGLVNAALAALGFDRINFLQSEGWAMWAVIAMWKKY